MLHVHCSICQESFSECSVIAALLCGHVFHYECIKSWLNNKPNCPHCRSPETAHYIKKLFFDKVSDANNSFLNDMDSNSDNVLKLQHEICKLSNSKDEIAEQRRQLMNELKTEKIVNESLKVDILHSQDLQKSQYLSFTTEIFEKDELITKYEAKLAKLTFVNAILDKNSSKISAELSQYKNPTLEIEKIISAVVCCKTELDFYKRQSEDLSKRLSRSETKNRLLTSTLEQQRLTDSPKTASGNRIECLTPSKLTDDGGDELHSGHRLQKQLSTPQVLLADSPATIGSDLKRRKNREVIAANPFRCSVTGKRGAARDVLQQLSIMKNHQSRQNAMPMNASAAVLKPWQTDNLARSRSSSSGEDYQENYNGQQQLATKKHNRKTARSKHIQPISRANLKTSTLGQFRSDRF